MPPIKFIIEPSTHPRAHSQDEQRYFSVFQAKTAPELTGFFESTVWNRLILQACHDELFAWHAVVAIGALHRTLELSHGPNQDLNTLKSHHAFALKQYGTALQHMRRVAQQQMNEYRLRNILVSCLLTTCFECFIGNQEHALIQAQSGIDVLMSWPFGDRIQDDDITSARTMTARTLFLDDDLLGVLTRLDFQVMQFKQYKHGVKTRPPPPKYPTIPAKFTSVTEARFYWDTISRRLRQCQVFQRQDNTSGNFQDLDADRAERELKAYEEVTCRWFKTFNPLFEESRKEPGSKTFLAASMMMVRYLPSKFAMWKAPVCDIYTDQYLEDFKKIVHLVREVLEEHSVAPASMAVYGMEVNFVLGLFLVGTRCREPKVRREAIALLVKHPRREFLGDSLMAAKVARWLMEKEEEGMVDGFVPEMARLRIVKHDFLLKERWTVIRCSKLVEGCDERITLPEVKLTW